MSARHFALLVLVTLVTNAWFLSAAGPGFPLDDAWIHMAYARSFADLQGFAFNAGEPSAGVTAPLWTVLLAIPEWLWDHLRDGGRADAGARALGGLVGLLTAWAGYRLASRAGLWPAVSAAAALTLDPFMIFTRFSGMELPLFALLSLLLVEALLDGRPTHAGWLGGLLCLTRPEGLVLVVVGLVVMRLRRAALLRYLAPVALCVAPWMTYCQLVAGHPFPNTVAVKAHWGLAVFDGGEFVLGYVLAHWWDVLVALVRDTGWGWALPLSVLAGTISLNGGHRLLGTLLLLSAITLFGAVLVTRTWEFETIDGAWRIPFYWARYGLLAWPLVLVVASAGVGSLVRTGYAAFFCRLRAAPWLIGPLLLVLALGWRVPGRFVELRERFAAQCAQVEAQQVAAGQWIDAHLPPGGVVATHDVGAVKYFGRRYVFDFFGITDNALAAALRRGDVQGQLAAEARLRQVRPDAIVCLPLLYAPHYAQPEVARLEAEYAARGQLGEWQRLQARILSSALPRAQMWGLSERAATFSVPRSAVMDSLFHRDLAILVRPE